MNIYLKSIINKYHFIVVLVIESHNSTHDYLSVLRLVISLR